MIPRYFLSCLCLKHEHAIKDRSMSDYYLNKGVKMLGDELDIIELVKMRQNSDTMKAILFSKL